MKVEKDFLVEWKMKNVQANRRMMVIAAVVAGILIPRLGVAEGYDSLPAYNSAVSASLGRADSAISSASSAASAAAGKPGSSVVDNLRADLTERLQKSQKALEVAKIETEKRKRNEGGAKDIDQLRATLALPDIIANSKVKEREAKEKELAGIISSMPQPNQGLNPASIDTSKLGEACASNVNFQEFKALSDQLKTEPFQYLKREGTKIVEERNEETKKKKLETLTKLAAHFDTLAKQPVVASNAPPQLDITKAGADFLKRDNSLEARLAGLDKTWDEQKKEIGTLRQELVKKTFTDFIPALSQTNDNDEKISAIVGGFADSMLAMTRAAKEKGIASAGKVTRNCNAIVNHIGKSASQPGSLFDAAFKWVSTINDNYANTTFKQGLQQMASKLKCKDVSQDVEAALGADLEAQIQVLRQIRNPKQAIEGAMAVMNVVGGRMAQAGDAIYPALAACKKNEDTEKKLEQYVQGAQQQNAQLAAQDAGGSGSTAGRRKGGSRAGLAGRNAATHSNQFQP